jgi:hypothetical protein
MSETSQFSGTSHDQPRSRNRFIAGGVAAIIAISGAAEVKTGKLSQAADDVRDHLTYVDNPYYTPTFKMDTGELTETDYNGQKPTITAAALEDLQKKSDKLTDDRLAKRAREFTNGLNFLTGLSADRIDQVRDERRKDFAEQLLTSLKHVRTLADREPDFGELFKTITTLETQQALSEQNMHINSRPDDGGGEELMIVENSLDSEVPTIDILAQTQIDNPAIMLEEEAVYNPLVDVQALAEQEEMLDNKLLDRQNVLADKRIRALLEKHPQIKPEYHKEIAGPNELGMRSSPFDRWLILTDLIEDRMNGRKNPTQDAPPQLPPSSPGNQQDQNPPKPIPDYDEDDTLPRQHTNPTF